MAMNLLPLLLVGSAAAYVVTSEKKKKDTKECPASSKVSMTELATVGMVAVTDHGKSPDPSDEIAYYMKEVLPKGCTISSKGSHIKLTFPGVETPFDLTIPDFYAFTYIGAWGRRREEGIITEEQLNAALSELFKWYKSVTGENLDLMKIGEFGDFLMEVGGSIMTDMPGSIDQGEPTESEESTCPPVFDYVYDEQEDAKMAAAFEQGRQLYPNDPFKIADVTFAATAPPGCTKRDFNTKVLMTINPPGSSSEYDAPVLELDMASMYAILVMEAADRIGLSPSAKDIIASKVADNYQMLTGKPLSI